jgi:ribosomal protein S18 acetylase RimI-like enzyme
MHVARLQPSDASPYRQLMLEAYELAADAFTSTAEERKAEPESFWIKRIADPTGMTAAFGAFEGQELVGTVALEYSAKPKTKHKALVIGMYVTPAARGRNAARKLLEAAIEDAKAREGVIFLTLTATEGNEPAVNLYRTAGFEVFGIEPMAILTPSGYKAKVHMWVPLTRASTAA